MITPFFALDLTSGVLNPKVTFNRTGATATVTDSSGYVQAVAADTARFDYDPLTLACLGLLIEEQRTNLITYSSDFRNTTDAGTSRPWVYTRATITTNAGVAPDNTNTAQKVIADTQNNYHGVYFPYTGTNGVTYSVSIYAKAVDAGYNFLSVADGAFSMFAIVANLSTGVITQESGAGIVVGSAKITPAANGFYRVSFSYTSDGNIAYIRAVGATQSTTPNAGAAYTGNGVSGILIWGAQLEVGAFSTSYIPTTTTAMTRNADVATITGTAFSGFWQATRGGALVRARPGTVSGTRPWVQFDDNTADNIISLRGNTTNPELYIVDGGVAQAQIDAGTIASNTNYSLTGWWATNDCKARLDSGAVVTDTSTTIPTVTQARLGSDGTNYLNGHLASISYYDSFSEQIYTRRKNKAVFNLM